MEKTEAVKTLDPLDKDNKNDAKTSELEDVMKDPKVTHENVSIVTIVKYVLVVVLLCVIVVLVYYVSKLKRKRDSDKTETNKLKMLIQKRDRELNESLNYIADLKQVMQENRANSAIEQAVARSIPREETPVEKPVEKERIITRLEAKRLQQTLKDHERKSKEDNAVNMNEIIPSEDILESSILGGGELNE